MENKFSEIGALRKLALELWHLYCDVKLSDVDTLKSKIQELNTFVSSYGEE